MLPTPTPTPSELQQAVRAIIESNSNFQETLALSIVILFLAVILMGMFISVRYGILGRIFNRKAPVQPAELVPNDQPDVNDNLVGALSALIKAMESRDQRLGVLADRFDKVADAITNSMESILSKLERQSDQLTGLTDDTKRLSDLVESVQTQIQEFDKFVRTEVMATLTAILTKLNGGT